jgi:hypothetical protein
MKLVEITTVFEKALDHLFGAYEDKHPTTEQPELKALGEKYKLEIITGAKSDHPDATFDACNTVQEKFAADLLSTELSVYPPEIIHASKVERVVVCSGLSADGRDVQGLAQMGLFVVDTIFLEISRVMRDWEYARLAFHHELFHAIDYHDDLCHYVDLSWRHLNNEEFDYDFGLFKGFNEPCDRPGFLSTYSMSCPWEEKAEVYAHLIVNTVCTEQRAANDPVLSKKVDRMKQLLFNFSPHYTDEFWAQCRAKAGPNAGRKQSEWALGSSKVHAGNIVDLPLQPGAEAQVFKITLEKQNGTKIWRLQRVSTSGGAAGPERVFYTFNKLSSCLRKLKVKEIITKDSLSESRTVNGLATKKTLAALSL